MDFFDEVAKKVSDCAAQTGKKAGEITNRAKIRFALINMQSDLDELYEKLGSIRYDTVENGAGNESREKACINKIRRLKNDMDILRAELELAHRENVCANCGEKITKNALYCPFCGEETK